MCVCVCVWCLVKHFKPMDHEFPIINYWRAQYNRPENSILKTY